MIKLSTRKSLTVLLSLLTLASITFVCVVFGGVVGYYTMAALMNIW